MATLRNKRKLAAMARKTQEYPRNNQSQKSAAPEMTQDYIAQVSKEIEEGLLRNYHRNSAGQSPTSYLHSPSCNSRISPEPTKTVILGNHSGKIPEHWGRKPGTKRGSFPEWSPYWSGVLCLSCQQSNWIRPGRDLSQDHLTALHWMVFEKSNFKLILLLSFFIITLVVPTKPVFLNQRLSDSFAATQIILRCPEASKSIKLDWCDGDLQA